MRYYFLKLKEDFFSQKRIRALCKLPNGEAIIVMYLRLQLLSLNTEGVIRYEGIEPTPGAELAMMLTESEEKINSCIETLIELGLIERIDDNTLLVVDVKQATTSESKWAEYKRNEREKKQDELNELDIVQRPQLSTLDNVKRPLFTDIEIDIDKEVEVDKKPGNIPYDEVVKLWNEVCTKLPKVAKLSATRKKQIQLRYKEGFTLERMQTVFNVLNTDNFYTGNNNRGWKATIDYIFQNDSNWLKRLEEAEQKKPVSQAKKTSNKNTDEATRALLEGK